MDNDFPRPVEELLKEEFGFEMGDGEASKLQRQEEEQPTSQFKPFTPIGELLEQEFPETEWLVDGLIPAGGLVALSGFPGSFKTWLSQYLTLCVAKGDKLFGQFETSKGGVLIIDRESLPRLIQERFKKLGATPDLSIEFWLDEFHINDWLKVKALEQRIKEADIKLVVFDSLIRIHKGDENSAQDMAQVFKVLRRFQEAGATVMFIHHHRKQSFFGRSVPAENLRGSSDILAVVDSHLAVDLDEDGTVKITQTKLRQGEANKPFKVKFVEVEGILTFNYEGEIDEQQAKGKLTKEAILQYLSDGEEHPRKEIHEVLMKDFGRVLIDKELRKLKDDEKVGFRKGTKNQFIFFLSEKDKGLF